MYRCNLAAAVIVVVILRCPVALAVPQPDLSSNLANTLTHVGISVPVLTAASLVVVGDEKQRQVGRQSADALVVTAAATRLLKEITDQSRPYDPQATDGFPSGHASITFTFARCIADEYEDWGKLAYLWAAGVSWSRVRREEHSIPQVLAGAALGTYIADRSIHSDGGLLKGLIVKETPLAFTIQPTEGLITPRLSLWHTSW